MSKNYERRGKIHGFTDNPRRNEKDQPYFNNDPDLEAVNACDLSKGVSAHAYTTISDFDAHTSTFLHCHAYAANNSAHSAVSLDEAVYQHGDDLAGKRVQVEVSRFTSGEFVVNLIGFSDFKVERLESGVIQIVPIR